MRLIKNVEKLESIQRVTLRVYYNSKNNRNRDLKKNLKNK